MRSKKWASVRERILKSRGYACERCGCEKDKWTVIQVHHLNYKRLGRELDTDLQVLCLKCHQDVHGRFFDEPVGLYPYRFSRPWGI
jgi:5-methylcytosine-specific restriction endonuclease McrA